jgi:hypothetical protein
MHLYWRQSGTEGFLGRAKLARGRARCNQAHALILMGDWCVLAVKASRNH